VELIELVHLPTFKWEVVTVNFLARAGTSCGIWRTEQLISIKCEEIFLVTDGLRGY